MTIQHGGARKGAGRPRKNANVLKQEGIVARRLKGGAEQGWEVLAEKYPSLIRMAVDLALGKTDKISSPNVPMLKTLLELMPKVVGTDPDTATSPITQLLERVLAAKTDALGSEDRPDMVIDSARLNRDADS